MLLVTPVGPTIVYAAPGQPKPTSSASQWGACALSPEKIAQRTDLTLHTIKNTSVTYQYRFKLSTGQGTMIGMATIKDQKTFRIQPCFVDPQEHNPPTWDARVASGGMLAEYPKSSIKEAKIGPFSDRFALPTKILDAWMRGNIKLLFGGIGSAANPLEALVKAAQTTPGYVARSQQRTISVEIPAPRTSLSGTQVVPITQYRLAILRPGEDHFYYEIIIDSKYFLPITMNNSTGTGKSLYHTAMYQTRWDRNLKSFPPHSFSIKVPHLESRHIR